MDDTFTIVALTDGPLIGELLAGKLSTDGTFVAMLPIEYGPVVPSPEKLDCVNAPRLTEDAPDMV